MDRPIARGSLLVCAAAAACSGSSAQKSAPAVPESARYRGGSAPHTRAADKTMVAVAGGAYIAGSILEERLQAYDDYRRTSGRDTARKGGWFEREEERHRAQLESYRIDLTPVTNAAYAEFVADTGAAPPRIDRRAWADQGFVQDYETEVARFNWTDQGPPPGRESHPVVLVTWKEASDYCAWRGQVVGAPRRLPSEDEFERAARGTAGRVYPWGDEFDPDRLNSAVAGPRDTVPVASYPGGKSPAGVLGMAGNVFQWLSTPWPPSEGKYMVKGSAWDDYGGVGRGAARHGRRAWVRHAIVGFRCTGPA